MSHLKTLSDLRTSVRFNVDETTAAFWSNARLNDCIVHAVDQVRLEALKHDPELFSTTLASTVTTTTILSETYDPSASMRIVAGTTTQITLPPDFLSMQLVETITTGYEDIAWIYRPFNHPDVRAMRALTDQVSPAYFVYSLINERTMAYAPRTNTTLDIQITYTQQLSALATDADTLSMPYPLYVAVEQFATAHALAQDRNPDSAAWEAWGRTSIARVIGSRRKQNQDPEFVQGYLGDWTGHY